MPQRFADAIMKYLASRDYQPLKPRQLARLMGVAEDDYGSFREAVKQLRDAGRIVLGAKDALMLPDIPSRITGFFRGHQRGFGFVVPEAAHAHGDLFIPPDATGGAITGDLVLARVVSRAKKDGKPSCSGEVIEIVQRGKNRFVGTLQQTGNMWFVLPDGTQMTQPIVIRDIGIAGPKAGSKVVAEIVNYSKAPGELPTGVIVEQLGQPGNIDVETLAVIRAHGLPDAFSEESLQQARAAVAGFDGNAAGDREDLTASTIVTIDPPDARDFDDAISLEQHADGTATLGVHIADVSYFVPEGSALDIETCTRSTSVYFPRRVVPMLPEILSNGVCSLQEGQRRYCKSAFITYNREANVIGMRFSESVIASAKRLTYQQAQDICDSKTGGYEPAVVELVGRMEKLARQIEHRRRKAGMLHLDLPEVDLVFDDENRVIDAVPEDQAYTHTIIEMFMVEANEAVGTLLDGLNRAFLRRIHPDPDVLGGKGLSTFVKACGHKLPPNPTPREIQELLARVRGRPESYAVNLAVLKTFQQAEYSPMRIGHFALASQNYCHFTSPIRRYPDLTVHRLFAEYVQGRLESRPPDDMAGLVRLGEQCTAAEKRAEAAENELREVLILQFLQTKVGEGFDGVITGITNFGIFVQSMRFLIEGLLRLEDLGDDWFELSPKTGEIRGTYSGKVYRMGDVVKVRIGGVDLARRQLNLVLDTKRDLSKPSKAVKGRPPGRGGGKSKAFKGPRRGKGPADKGPRNKGPRKGRRR